MIVKLNMLTNISRTCKYGNQLNMKTIVKVFWNILQCLNPAQIALIFCRMAVCLFELILLRGVERAGSASATWFKISQLTMSLVNLTIQTGHFKLTNRKMYGSQKVWPHGASTRGRAFSALYLSMHTLHSNFVRSLIACSFFILMIISRFIIMIINSQIFQIQ
jgi:hypothetical protein